MRGQWSVTMINAATVSVQIDATFGRLKVAVGLLTVLTVCK